MKYKKLIPFDDSLKEDMIVQGKVKVFNHMVLL